MIILKLNANQDKLSRDMIDIIVPWIDNRGNKRSQVWATVHIDLFYDAIVDGYSDEINIYEYLNRGDEVAISLSVDKDWLQEQRELER